MSVVSKNIKLQFTVIILACFFLIKTLYALDEKQLAEMVETHNQYRTEVNVPAVTWSAKLANIAQAYADNLRDTRACNLVHSNTQGLGENLFWASAKIYSSGKRIPQTISAQDVVESWGSEKHDYNYTNNSCASGKVCGHYTQIIWKTTKEIGCANAMCGDGSQVWVCHYSPAGNYIGQKPY